MQAPDGTEALVIDCSVTMAWYFQDEATPYTDAVRDCLATERALVPALWPLEVANVLLMGERRKRSTPAKAARWLGFLDALPIAVDGETPHRAFADVVNLARAHGLTAYDAAYLELAARRGLPLASLDGDLVKSARAVGVPIFSPGTGLEST